MIKPWWVHVKCMRIGLTRYVTDGMVYEYISDTRFRFYPEGYSISTYAFRNGKWSRDYTDSLVAL